MDRPAPAQLYLPVVFPLTAAAGPAVGLALPHLALGRGGVAARLAGLVTVVNILGHVLPALTSQPGKLVAFRTAPLRVESVFCQIQPSNGVGLASGGDEEVRDLPHHVAGGDEAKEVNIAGGPVRHPSLVVKHPL